MRNLSYFCILGGVGGGGGVKGFVNQRGHGDKPFGKTQN